MTRPQSQAGHGWPTHSMLSRALGAALACYWTAMFFGTHLPLPRLEQMPPNSDKFLHFAGYGGLAFLFGLWRSASRGPDGWSAVRVFLLIAGYGVADELLQMLVGRTADVRDFAADLTGAAVGLAAAVAAGQLLTRRLPAPAEVSSKPDE